MIGTGTPWTRQALKEFAHYHPDEHAALLDSIPEGHRITLICGYRPRPLGAILNGPDGAVARVEPRYHTVSAACYAVLAKAREIVVERTDGYVVTAEVA